MMEDMFATMQRINEIKKKFSVKRHNAIKEANGFDRELAKRTPTAKDAVNREDDPSGSSPGLKSDKAVGKKGHPVTVDEIKKIAKNYSFLNKVPYSLVNAVIATESSYNPRAVSPKGALGLMQLMPEVARDLDVENPFVPEENIRGGVTLLRRLLEKYNWDYKKALAAYNAGENAVDTNGGIPPYAETKEYVKKVIDTYLKNAE